MTLTKLEVAVVQLDSAIGFFLQRDRLSSLTLAGVAEEILGKLCERSGKPVALEEIIKFHWGDTDPELPATKRRAILLGVLNGARNAAKHANGPNEKEFQVEDVFPLQMIMRAMPMARSLGSRPVQVGDEPVDQHRCHAVGGAGCLDFPGGRDPQ